MKKVLFKDKYPIFVTTILKSETEFKNTNEIVDKLKEEVQKHPIASLIAVFDHLEHTKNLNEHDFLDDLIDAKNLIFCFGKEILTSQILALRPRSIGVCEFEDRFEISFLEVPKEKPQKTVESWIEGLRT
jgi:hypothetical protein